jgi:hypothetical protein
MATLVFKGRIKAGIGKFKQMEIPGCHVLQAAPDWPEKLCPGSLNIVVDDDGYPAEFLRRCSGEWVKKLDSECFRPAFTIPGKSISKNKLVPKPDNPRRGDAQVWRATLSVPKRGRCERCWLLRRFGSGLGKQLELVARDKLRDKLDLKDGDEVELFVDGEWAGS